MRYFLLFCLAISIFSCGKDKVLQLPEISHSEISKINDVSAAYLFYAETKTDSVELNRKNLISSTNWLINIDKRLTLKQVIPHIKFLQEKKRNSSHKKENTKNYFTCNNASKKNLGFIEFTDLVYDTKGGQIGTVNNYSIAVINLNNIIIYPLNQSDYKTSITSFVKDINKTLYNDKGNSSISLSFHNNLSFQDYISFKSILLKLDLENVTISNHEFIFN